MDSKLGKSWLIAGYVFLYVPILTLIIFSFNESKMVTLWGGFSFKWYGVIMHDSEVVNGFILSMKIALLTATASVVLGTFAAFAMVRYKSFFGRTAFFAHINAPLVVPEVITGLSLLLFFVMCERLIGYPERGIFTIWVGHTTFGLSYAAVIIQSRLLEMDKSLEEAAMDLGCKPFQVFYLVTLPLIVQSLMAAWLLTFTISLDDVVTTAFLSGPGSSTLPLVILSRARLGLDPTVNAIATITVAVVSVGVVAGSLWMSRQERMRAAEQSAAYREGMQAVAA
ncbi:MAG: ABC transporter permease subunit [Gallionella sp.]